MLQIGAMRDGVRKICGYWTSDWVQRGKTGGGWFEECTANGKGSSEVDMADEEADTSFLFFVLDLLFRVCPTTCPGSAFQAAHLGHHVLQEIF